MEATPITTEKFLKWDSVTTVGLFAPLLALCLFCLAYIKWAEPGSRFPNVFDSNRLTLFLVSVLALAIMFTAIGRGINGRWFGILIDDNNRFSLSVLQTVLWSTLLLAIIVAGAIDNVASGRGQTAFKLGIPSEFWILIGISTSTLVGAKIIKTNGNNQQLNATLTKNLTNLMSTELPDKKERVKVFGKIVGWVSPVDAELADLVRGEQAGNALSPDLGKIQMLFLTLVIVGVYGIVIGNAMKSAGVFTCPEFDESLIALIAISHVGYLSAKLVPQDNAGAA